jgi:hypothetical protein
VLIEDTAEIEIQLRERPPIRSSAGTERRPTGNNSGSAKSDYTPQTRSHHLGRTSWW